MVVQRNVDSGRDLVDIERPEDHPVRLGILDAGEFLLFGSTRDEEDRDMEDLEDIVGGIDRVHGSSNRDIHHYEVRGRLGYLYQRILPGFQDILLYPFFWSIVEASVAIMVSSQTIRIREEGGMIHRV